MGEHPETHGGTSKIMLEGTYSPADYLEEPVTLGRSDYTATIKEGRIEVIFHHPEPLPDTVRQAAVHREVAHIFHVHMILTGQSSEMTDLTLKRYYPDGRSDVWVNATGLCIGVSLCKGVTAIEGAHGSVVKNTKAERLSDEQAFRDQYLRHIEDPLLNRLLASFRQAVNDPKDLMTHLYEIRDALRDRFGTIRGAKGALGLTDEEWDELDDITNNRPVEESRHRGRHPVRRPATENERSRVFAVAQRMIRAYLDHLDRSSTAA